MSTFHFLDHQSRFLTLEAESYEDAARQIRRMGILDYEIVFIKIDEKDQKFSKERRWKNK